MLAPTFHSWFRKTQLSSFQELINYNIDREVEDSRFFNNLLEVLHKPQMKKVNKCNLSNDVFSINEAMQDWVFSYYKETIRALYGHGKYWLATSDQHFVVIPTK